MSGACNCEPEIELPCLFHRTAEQSAGPTCARCNLPGHTAAEPHCALCNVTPADHKIAEDGSGGLNFHELTNYLCCAHFRRVVGDCSRFPTYGHREREDA